MAHVYVEVCRGVRQPQPPQVCEGGQMLHPRRVVGGGHFEHQMLQLCEQSEGGKAGGRVHQVLMRVLRRSEA
eukprot:scaffold132815_cov39-Prasinocladus_malaysianus.AAC.1